MPVINESTIITTDMSEPPGVITRLSDLPPVLVGAKYHSLDDAINAARVHAQKANFSYRVKDRNKKRVVLKCSGQLCQAYMRVHLSKKHEQYVVGKFKDDHSCQGTLQASRGSQKDHRFLCNLIQEAMPISKDTKVKDVRSFFKQQLGIDTPYSTAHKAKEAVLNESVDAQREQFSLLYSYVEKLIEVDAETLAVLKVQEEIYSAGVSERFHSVFIAPGAARNAFQYMRRFVAVDGTFTKNRFIQILLLAVGMDANDQLVVIAWAVVPNESQETWTWFLAHLRHAFPLIDHQETVIINDREKGLLNAIQQVVPNAFNAYCCWHIASNVQVKFGLAAKKLFWRAAYADTQSSFDACIAELSSVKEQAAQYVLAIPHNHWATYAMEARRFGHCTSNLAEIANSVLRNIRELPLLEMLDSLYRHQMEKFYQRRTEAMGLLSPLVPTALAKFNHELTSARSLNVYPSTSGSGVVISSNGKQFLAELPKQETPIGTCSCRFFQSFLMPCRHACALAIKVHVPPISLVSEVYSLQSYRKTYEKAYQAVIIDSLQQRVLLPPSIIRPRGRPRSSRKEKGCNSALLANENSTTTPACKTCGLPGHNRRTCREAHI